VNLGNPCLSSSRAPDRLSPLSIALRYPSWHTCCKNHDTLNVIEGVRIRCCENCIQIQTFQFLHVPWGDSSFHLKYHFAVIIIFDFTWYHFVLNNIEGVMIPCCAPYTLIQIEYFVHKPWGSSSYYNIITQFVLFDHLISLFIR
jgi:hypothetical protein